MEVRRCSLCGGEGESERCLRCDEQHIVPAFLQTRDEMAATVERGRAFSRSKGLAQDPPDIIRRCYIVEHWHDALPGNPFDMNALAGLPEYSDVTYRKIRRGA